jgi:hypothetical protein
LAAAAYAENDKLPPPQEIELMNDCQAFHALPEPGGILDQPAGLLRRLRILSNVYHAHQLYKNFPGGHMAEFAHQHPDEWQTVQKVMEMRANA